MQLQYRVIRFQPNELHACVQYIGMAWNYDLPAFFSTYATTSYDGAVAELLRITKSYTLRWFDGEYQYDPTTGQIFNAPVRNESEARSDEVKP